VGATEGGDKITNALMNSRTNELPAWQLVIAGPDEQGTKEKLRGISEKLKLKTAETSDLSSACDADIVFLEAVQGDAKWALMQRADIFVLASRSENFGMVVGEALSCGVPVVTTAVGPWGEEGEVRECGNVGMREWERGEAGASDRSPVLMEKRGLIVVETSVAGIAEGLRQMMALNDAERKEMGLRGCEWVKREFSWESVAQQMVAAYGIAEK
jgi:glycosyltransferase involved in cell wall biosynthesis